MAALNDVYDTFKDTAGASSSNTPVVTGDVPVVSTEEGQLEAKLIDEEYKIWKKNTPFLYDLVMTHALEWPSLTCQFLPTVTSREADCFRTHRLLLGTHTSGAPNSLLVASVRLPKDEESIAAGARNAINAGQDYSETDSKVTVEQRINHPGEVNCARYMPQDEGVIATKAVDGDVLVFRLADHPKMPVDADIHPQVVCKGHTKDGYGLAWNPNQRGQLLSGADDALICVWDVTAQAGADKTEARGSVYKGHKSVVGDVAWHKMNAHTFASVSDDQSLLCWDVRSRNGPVAERQNAHSKEVNSLDFSPFDEHFLLTGGSDHVVHLWDTRKLSSGAVHTFRGHASEIFNVQFSPHLENIFISASSDRRIHVWDVTRIGVEQSEMDAEDGPPELLFVHGGHTARISDLSWNLNDEWVVASVADDNILQVWAMGENIYNPAFDPEGGAAAGMEA